MKDRLIHKLESIRSDASSDAFIIADAKDADMAWGIASPGRPYPPGGDSRPYLSMPEFYEQIREVVRQGLVDVMLASVSAMSRLAHEEKLFENSDVSPAIRANDTSDVWCARGARYRAKPSRPFSTCYLEEAQYGSLVAERSGDPVVNLGLYSVTFNNDLEADRETLQAFKEFRRYAQTCGFNYFLEVFAPNCEAGLQENEVAGYVNDMITRMLAAVPAPARPEFLKIPYLGPRAMEELVQYDPSMVVGILGGGSGTTYDAFKLIAEAQKYGARVALYGRKIKDAEHPLSFISMLRAIVEKQITPEEAVKAYHGELQRLDIPPMRSLEEDMELTTNEMSYAR